MKKYRSMAACLVFLMTTFLLTTGICAAQTLEETQIAIDNLDITAIKSLQIGTPSGGKYPTTFTILVDNKNTRGLRLIKSNFNVEFRDDATGENVNIGRAEFLGGSADYDLEIDGATIGREVTLTVKNVSIDQIIKMINIIGKPAKELRMTLNGNSEVALQVGRGWVRKEGDKYAVELTWKPDNPQKVFMK